ncbi:MAG: tRNA (adenosine(37)-N6)-dimethylallyltransferase MiaA, partial [Acholeplasmataceae bacterium]
MKKVLVIVGPTASGKTALGVELAKHFGTEIINGDSVQVYQSYDIGSAKVTEQEKQGVRHHLLDVVDPSQHYDVNRFQSDARQLIEHLSFPLIVGGTGFYIKAALYDYDFSAAERQEKENELTNEALYSYIKHHDPKYEGDPHNRRRLLRAYELIQQGHLPSSKNGKNKPLYDVLTIYLDIERQLLKKRLWQRLEKQLSEGFVEEVKTIRASHKIKDVIGYREIEQY